MLCAPACSQPADLAGRRSRVTALNPRFADVPVEAIPRCAGHAPPRESRRVIGGAVLVGFYRRDPRSRRAQLGPILFLSSRE